ncbi:MAG TPA: radical SAM protein [Anaerolineae bacterium]|nr:radical SAM protein [Anaerolineae bacterium]
MDCADLPGIGYGDFSERLHKKALATRTPVSGAFELTFRCNLRCKHCYVGDARGGGAPNGSELSFKQWRSIFDQVADAGTLWVLLTGGDPLLHPDFEQIYTYVKRKGFIVQLFTNGTLLTPRMLDLLAENPPFYIEISLYGLTQETYERVTGIPGSHARCMRGIEALLERGLPLQLKTMVMTLNRHELWDMQAYARNLGVKFRYDALIHGTLDGSLDVLKYRLSPADVVAIDWEDPERRAAFELMRQQLQSRKARELYLYTCGAGITSYRVDPSGLLGLCIADRRCAFDLLKGSFMEGWEEYLFQFRYQYPKSSEYRCNVCPLIGLCGQCPAWAEMESGDPEIIVPYLCEVGHLRGERLSI